MSFGIGMHDTIAAAVVMPALSSSIQSSEHHHPARPRPAAAEPVLALLLASLRPGSKH